MKAQILDITGKKAKDLTLPKCFSEAVRSDLIQKIIDKAKIVSPLC